MNFQKSNYFFFKCCLVLIISVVTFKKVGLPMGVGLDHSWVFGINYFFSNSIRMGTDVIFTYGPLGFLIHAIPLGINYEIALAFWTITHLVFSWLLLSLVWSYHKTSALWIKLLSTLLLIVFINSLKLELIPIFFVFTSTLLYTWENKPQYALLAAFSATLACLIKIGTGIVCFLIMGSLYILTKRSLKEHQKLIFVLISTVITTYLTIWVLLYGDLGGSFDFLSTNKELVKGYSSAVSIYIPLKESFIFLGIANYILCIFLWKNHFPKIIHLSLALPLLAWFKYTFGRADPYHIIQFWIILLALSMFLLLFLKRSRDLIPYGLFITVSWALALGLYEWTPNKLYKPPLQLFAQTLSDKTFRLDGYNNFYSSLLSSNRKEHLIKLSKNTLQKDLLDPSILEYVGNNTVDIYPWELSIIPANQLNWKPRKVIQSYYSFTQSLDQTNSISVSKKTSAKYLIWHNTNFGSIDQRYLLNDEPKTIYQILKNYKIGLTTKDFVVLEKTDQSLLGEPQFLFTSEHLWDQWIDVPEGTKEIIQGDVSITRTLLGKLKRQIFKEEPFHITYRLENNHETRYRMVPDTAVNGIWMNPFIGSIKTKKQFSCSRGEIKNSWVPSNHIISALDNLQLGNGTVKISGWIKGNQFSGKTKPPQKSILLKNIDDKSLFICGIDSVERPEVNQPSKFKNGELISSGFQGIFDTSSLHKGKYIIGFLMKREGKVKFHFTNHWFSPVDVPKNFNLWNNQLDIARVKQIKFSHNPNDFIEDTIQINWKAIPILND
jgi:hypothetical protein